MTNKKATKKGQSNQGGQESHVKKGTSITSDDSKKGIASMNSEEQKEISSKKSKALADYHKRIGSNSSGKQLDKASSKQENQGRSRGLGKRPGPQGKEGKR